MTETVQEQFILGKILSLNHGRVSVRSGYHSRECQLHSLNLPQGRRLKLVCTLAFLCILTHFYFGPSQSLLTFFPWRVICSGGWLPCCLGITLLCLSTPPCPCLFHVLTSQINVWARSPAAPCWPTAVTEQTHVVHGPSFIQSPVRCFNKGEWLSTCGQQKQ